MSTSRLCGMVLGGSPIWLIVPMMLAAAPAVPVYREAPMLASQVASGDLPPISERLPAVPQVVAPISEIGEYGGTWRRLGVSANDTLIGSRLGYESLVRWDRSGRHVEPGIATSWDIENDGCTYIFHLRPGMRWSDGAAFSSADFLFWYEDILLNKDLTPVFPNTLCPAGGTFRLEAPDPLTVVFHFDRPNGLFLEAVCFRGGMMLHPRHYLSRYHIHYRSEEELLAEAKESGFDLWHQLFWEKAALHDNPDLPTIRAWKLAVPPPASRLVVERNPYYWKVDSEGNQLPYIDRIATTLLQNKEVLNLKAMTGGVDMQSRYIDSANYTLFMKNRDKSGYRVMADTTPGGTVIYLNQHSKNPAMRPLLQDRRFRVALSVAINRPELIELIYSGLAEPSNGVSSDQDPYYLPEFADMHIQYDPELANRLLDEVGLKRGRSGMRRMPDGSRFQQILHFYPAETGGGAELWQLVADYWREVGLEFLVKGDARTLSVMQVNNGNSDFWAYAIAGIHWVVDPGWYVPLRDGSYFAPLYGRYVVRGGRSGVEPRAEFQELLDTFHELAGISENPERKLELGQRILRQWVEQCYLVGVVKAKELTILSDAFGNVSESIIHDYRLMSPGYLQPEQFYLRQDAQ